MENEEKQTVSLCQYIEDVQVRLGIYYGISVEDIYAENFVEASHAVGYSAMECVKRLALIDGLDSDDLIFWCAKPVGARLAA